jgi:hypothetical protein
MWTPDRSNLCLHRTDKASSELISSKVVVDYHNEPFESIDTMHHTTGSNNNNNSFEESLLLRNGSTDADDIHCEPSIQCRWEPLDPTETDLTETECVEEEQEQQQQQVSSESSALVDELIERLQQVNKNESHGRTRVEIQDQSIELRSPISIEEMTDLLRGVDISDRHTFRNEKHQQQSRWNHHRTQSTVQKKFLTRWESDVAEGGTTIYNKDCHHHPVLQIQDIIERLSQVNATTIDSSPMEQALSTASNNNGCCMDIGEMTRILHHINTCETNRIEPTTISSWEDGTNNHNSLDEAVVQNVMLGKGKSAAAAAAAIISDKGDGPISFNVSSHCNISDGDDHSSWTEEECPTSIDIGYCVDEHTTSHLDPNNGDCGFSLHPIPDSCASSVTWYEGSNIEEITVVSGFEDITLEDDGNDNNEDSGSIYS